MPEELNQVDLPEPLSLLNLTDQDINSRYINPKTDFAFKHFFGKEPHKDLLISFLNGVFKGRKVIIDLVYNSTELKGSQSNDRKTIFDLYCTGKDGDMFIVEMQQAKQEFFKDRMIYYTSNLIYHQGKPTSSKWNYELPEIYLIAIMDFSFDNTHPNQYEHDVRLIDINSNTQFYNKLGYIFIEMPKFKKKETELETGEDAWLFSLRHMGTLTEIPVSLREKEEFVKLFNIAEVSNLNPDEMAAYEASLKIARDNYGHDETVRKEARHERDLEIAAELKREGMAIDKISKITKLTVKEIESL